MLPPHPWGVWTYLDMWLLRKRILKTFRNFTHWNYYWATGAEVRLELHTFFISVISSIDERKDGEWICISAEGRDNAKRREPEFKSWTKARHFLSSGTLWGARRKLSETASGKGSPCYSWIRASLTFPLRSYVRVDEMKCVPAAPVYGGIFSFPIVVFGSYVNDVHNANMKTPIYKEEALPFEFSRARGWRDSWPCCVVHGSVKRESDFNSEISFRASRSITCSRLRCDG